MEHTFDERVTGVILGILGALPAELADMWREVATEPNKIAVHFLYSDPDHAHIDVGDTPFAIVDAALLDMEQTPVGGTAYVAIDGAVRELELVAPTS
jgi:hypothetical protein